MPQEINEKALAKAKVTELPAAKPPQIDQETGEEIPGQAIRGTLPHKDIPHMEFPRAVHLHPKKPFVKRLLPVDGHGNKEWQWVANQAQTKVVKDKDELELALKQGWKIKHYVVPPPPVEAPEDDAPATV